MVCGRQLSSFHLPARSVSHRSWSRAPILVLTTIPTVSNSFRKGLCNACIVIAIGRTCLANFLKRARGTLSSLKRVLQLDPKLPLFLKKLFEHTFKSPKRTHFGTELYTEKTWPSLSRCSSSSAGFQIFKTMFFSEQSKASTTRSFKIGTTSLFIVFDLLMASLMRQAKSASTLFMFCLL